MKKYNKTLIKSSHFLKFSIFYILFYIFFMRFFTEEVVIFPRYAQLTDKPLVIIFLIIIIFNLHKLLHLNMYGFNKYIFIMIITYTISVILNTDSWQIFPIGTHFLLYFGPIIWFVVLSIFHLSEKDIKYFIKIFIGLIFFQVIVGFIQLPEGLAMPDKLRGTFGYGYKQLVFYYLFLAAILFGWYLYKYSDQFKKWILPISITFLAARMLVVFPAFFISLLLVYLIARKRKNVILPFLGLTVLFFVIFLSWGYFKEISGESYQYDRFENILINIFDILPRTGIIRSFIGWFNMLGDHPGKIFFGTGPATFGSRAFTNLFYDSDISTNVTSGMFSVDTAPELAFKYLIPAAQGGLPSITMIQPLNTYVGVLGELGIIGAYVFFAIYIKVFKDFFEILKSDYSSYLKGLAIGSMGAIIFLAQMSMFYDFFAVERINLGLWMLIAFVYKLSNYENKRIKDADNKSSFHSKHPGALPKATF